MYKLTTALIFILLAVALTPNAFAVKNWRELFDGIPCGVLLDKPKANSSSIAVNNFVQKAFDIVPTAPAHEGRRFVVAHMDLGDIVLNILFNENTKHHPLDETGKREMSVKDLGILNDWEDFDLIKDEKILFATGSENMSDIFNVNFNVTSHSQTYTLNIEVAFHKDDTGTLVLSSGHDNGFSQIGRGVDSQYLEGLEKSKTFNAFTYEEGFGGSLHFKFQNNAEAKNLIEALNKVFQIIQEPKAPSSSN